MKILFGLFSLIVLSACSTHYESAAIKSWDLMASGETDVALELYEKNVQSEKEALLRLMDEGILLRAAGRYEESNERFLQAADLIERAGYVSLSEQGAALLANEKQTTYQGEDFEKVLIHAFLAMNFIELEEWDSALVSARKVNEVLFVMMSEGKRPYEYNAFAKYLTGLLYEKDGDLNNAHISYKQIYESDKEFFEIYPQLKTDLLRTSIAMGFDQQVEIYRERFGEAFYQQARDSLRKREASVVLLFESGKSPQKYSSRERHQTTGKDGNLIDVALPIPYYKARNTQVSTAKLWVGEHKAQTAYLNDIEATAMRHLQDRMGRYIAKALAQAALKTGIAVGVGKATGSDELGILAGLALFLASEADTRSWLLLPEKLQVARLFVPAGTYSVRVQYLDVAKYVVHEEILPDLKLEERQLHFLQRRSYK